VVADIISLLLNVPQAGKGWDLFLLYSWEAQAERMGQPERRLLGKTPHLP
jgi:hypothetical protein